MSEIKKEEGLRFNSGKPRYDLFEPFAIEQLANVFTKGSLKYTDRNWEKGMSWGKCLASLKRHMAAFEKGEDYDFDPNCDGCKNKNCTNHTGELHTALAAWNALAITSYYKIFPQGDDRRHNYMYAPKIGLDIDEVLADWIGGYKEKYGYNDSHEFNSWYLHFKILDRCKEEMGASFYMNLKPKISPKDLPFVPHCYITSRNIPTHITEEWLYKHGFPCMPVYTIGLNDSKIEVAKNSGIDVFVDDVYKNFVDLNKAGICCYLMDAPHNRNYNVGYKRIFSLSDLTRK